MLIWPVYIHTACVEFSLVIKIMRVKLLTKGNTRTKCIFDIPHDQRYVSFDVKFTARTYNSAQHFVLSGWHFWSATPRKHLHISLSSTFRTSVIADLVTDLFFIRWRAVTFWPYKTILICSGFSASDACTRLSSDGNREVATGHWSQE